MVKAFKKKAPQVKLGKVTCVLPSNGTVVKCTVHASAPAGRENIVYKVKATLKDDGTITWVTTSHSCTDSKTGKAFSC